MAAAVAIAACIAPKVSAKEQDVAKGDASPAESAITRVDKLFQEWNKSDSPGCSIAISQNGAVVYERGYGMANLEFGVAITPASVFNVCSISKQFTAMRILLLAQRGQLSLDDEVRKYITELPDYGSRLTIRHLLNHTSGLREGFTLLGLGVPREDDVKVNDAVVNALTRQRGLNFTPGTQFQYNNGAYSLLAAVVKRVSGQSLRAFGDSNIFKPLGMTHTYFHDDPTMIVPYRASGYHRDAGGFQVAVRGYPDGVVGNAGLHTTARDLLVWEQNFSEVRVGDPALVLEMQKPAVPTGWSETSFYGLGLEIGQHRGLRTIGHGGGDPGYGAYVVRYPDQGFAIAVLGNVDNIDALGLTRGVADIYLADVMTAPSLSSDTSTPPSVSLTLEQLAAKAGLYHNPSTESVGQIFVRNGKLMASADPGERNSVELTPVSENRFVIQGTTVAIDFVPPRNGGVQELHETGTGLKPIISQKLDAYTPSSAELQAFAGEYTSLELAVTYTILTRDSNLIAQIPGRKVAVLLPVFRDAFSGIGILKFSRDGNGVVSGFTMNTSGARGMRFDRVQR